MTDGKIQHIAFIMDGNRRWAKKHGLPIAMGHKKGAETLVEIAKAAKKLQIKFMTVYAFSTENWQREPTEVTALMDLLRQYLDDSFKELQENNARIIFIGERNMLDADIQEKIARIEHQTAQNNAVTLCVALSYGARQEITAAVRKIARQVKESNLNIDAIDSSTVCANLYTKDIPDPDIIVRTSGEMRISNFLLWQAAYSEFYFSPTLWPDFSETELQQIIKDFEQRERRYGKS